MFLIFLRGYFKRAEVNFCMCLDDIDYIESKQLALKSWIVFQYGSHLFEDGFGIKRTVSYSICDL